MRKNLINSLIKRKFDTNTFKNEDQCAICLGEYTEESEVTPLPCDYRHYFHTQCIESWFERNNTCPLCKKVITKEDMDNMPLNHER
jgi:E3 ubiquitin-protein ligase DOA10